MTNSFTIFCISLLSLLLASCTRFEAAVHAEGGNILYIKRWGAPFVNTKGQRSITLHSDPSTSDTVVTITESGEEGTEGQEALVNKLLDAYLAKP